MATTFSDVVNRVQFISEDFDTYRSEADQFFQDNYPQAFNNLIATDLGNALMDQLAFAMQALAFTTNRRASELFLQTARLTSSIVKLARMLGYPIAPASPSTCQLNIFLTNAPYSFPVTIPTGFQFQGPGSVIYEYNGTSDYIIAPSGVSGTFPISEGQTSQVSFISNGTQNQQFNILGIPAGQFIYSDKMSLSVDGAAWTREDLIKYVTDNIYEVIFANNPPLLTFGDGIAGNMPPSGGQINLSYRYGQGIAGAIGQDQITSSVKSLIINGITIPMTFTNTVANVGSDPETIKHVQTFASTFFRTQQAAVVKSDYDEIAALQPGVALADAQILRGIDQDLTIQADLASIAAGETLILTSLSGIAETSITGTSYLGVENVSGLFVGGTTGLSVSGTQYLGVDVSGNVTGISSLGVQGVSGLYVGGTDSLGVSGISYLGFQDLTALVNTGVTGVTQIESSVSGLADYLSQILSDTSQSNNVQMVILSTDSNNKYIAPSLTTLQDVQATLQGECDAVVTVNAVDGSPNLVPVDITVTMGINQSAVKADVEQLSLNALTQTTSPYGLLVLRSAGQSLYVSDVENAIRDANSSADIRYIDVTIDGPAEYLDSYGNLIISKQQIIQNNHITVTVKQRFLSGNEVVNA